ncbi:MAG: GIY-YIG nuclease family protein [Flavobacteriaceae bacterium]|nr:GIY-YIG nuclease family protein [Flavobacteriaceae bacterium]
MYWTYAIIDPITRHLVYIGQTGNFERRKSEHLKPPRTKKTKHPKGSIKAWLAEAHAQKLTPQFMILETVETEEESLLSECKWVEKFSTIGHPLLNRWEEHKHLIEAGRGAPVEEFEAYWPGKWRTIIGEMEPTAKKAGYSLIFPKEIIIKAGGRLVILPKKKAAS